MGARRGIVAFALVAALCMGAAADAAGDDDLSWPLHGKVTGHFGELRAGHAHEGLDIPVPAGTPIRAASTGKVVMRELQDGYGKYTCVAHTRVTTCYGHQSRFATKLGEMVGRGQVIGYVGSTGNAPVNHLHFEVRLGTRPWGKPVNPMKFLPGAWRDPIAQAAARLSLSRRSPP